MKRIGWILMAIALLLALFTQLFTPKSQLGNITVALVVLLASMLLIVGSVVRIWQGKVKLRLWDALTKFGLFFVAMMAVHLTFAYFDTSKWSLKEALLISGVTSAVLALWSTAYRKPIA